MVSHTGQDNLHRMAAMHKQALVFTYFRPEQLKEEAVDESCSCDKHLTAGKS
jgi:hypothetical protein